MKFVDTDLCRRKREDKLDILMSDSLRRELGTESAYAYLRLVLPECDSARKVYNVKEIAMGKMLIKALRIPEGNIKAQRLIHYKNGTINPEGTGDLPATLESILKDGAFAAAHTDQPPLTIGEVCHHWCRCSCGYCYCYSSCCCCC
jgi:DNA ligase N terminus